MQLLNQPQIKTERDRFLEFDPNAPDMQPFATYCQRRQIRFKMHARRAQALQTFSQYANLATIYYWSANERVWEPLATKDRETKGVTCEHCLGSTAVHHPPKAGGGYNFIPFHLRGKSLDAAIYGKDMYDGGKFAWLRRNKKLIEPLQMLFLCDQCSIRYA